MKTRDMQSEARAARRSEAGVALVITLILLAIITFMAITLLVVTRGEKGSVSQTADQTTASLANDSALERVKIDLIAPMLAFTNPYNFDLLVSTSYINTNGFFPGIANPTNVNYEYLAGGGAPRPTTSFFTTVAS